MNVALNAHLLSFGTTYRGAGISRYIRNLINNLLVLGDEHYTVFLGDPRWPRHWSAGNRADLVVSSLATRKPPVRILWEQLVQPVELRRHGADLVHSMGYVKPLLDSTPSVLTVYDLSFFVYPEAFNRPNLYYLRWFTRLSAARSRKIIAISESTKRDAVRYLGVAPSMVQVIYPGIESSYSRIEDRAAVERFKTEKGLPERFVLFFGTLEPRKGVDSLIQAFADLCAKPGFSHDLVLAGAKGWLYESLFASVEARGLKDRIRFVGYVPAAEQRWWYNAADLFVYPSRYEGFGFPPAEAMACGTPVVTTNVSSLPEVVGDAALTVTPGDSKGLREAIATVLSESGLRDQLRASGLKRARLFDWRGAAEATLDVYRQSASNRMGVSPDGTSH